MRIYELGPRPALTRSRSLDLDSLPTPPRSPITACGKDESQVRPLESPVYISPSKAKHAKVKVNLNIDPDTNASRQGTRERRGTIRAADFPPVPAGGEGVGLEGGARRTRSGTIVGPARNRRERSGTVVGAVRPADLTGVSHVVEHGEDNVMDTGDVNVEMQSQRPAHDADVQMSDDIRTNPKTSVEGSGGEADPMNIVGSWCDEDWPWAVAEPPSPACPRRTRAGNRKHRSGLGLGLKMPKGWKLWQMREHDEEDGEDEDDPINLLQ
jgi:hypothetical protein